jgi:hypothetical protein
MSEDGRSCPAGLRGYVEMLLLSDLAGVAPPEKIKELAVVNAVEMFQESSDKDDYELLCCLYDPEKYMQQWRRKYGHLYDTREDFDGEFWLCFVLALKEFDRSRGASLNNLFYTMLNSHFVNQIKVRQTQRRSSKEICPICEKSVAPLGKHILSKHLELIDSMLAKMGHDINRLEECPLCPQYARARLGEVTPELLRKHIAAKHSSKIFDRLRVEFPDVDTAIKNPAPPMTYTMDGVDYGVSDAMDAISGIQPVLSASVDEISELAMQIDIALNDPGLSECQRSIIFGYLYDGLSKTPSHRRLCELCMTSRNTDECPRGAGFKLTKTLLKKEIEGLQRMLAE